MICGLLGMYLLQGYFTIKIQIIEDVLIFKRPLLFIKEYDNLRNIKISWTVDDSDENVTPTKKYTICSKNLKDKVILDFQISNLYELEKIINPKAKPTRRSWEIVLFHALALIFFLFISIELFDYSLKGALTSIFITLVYTIPTFIELFNLGKNRSIDSM